MERMREIEIFGVPALFTDKAIPPEDVYPGMNRYELRAGDGDPKRPRYAATQSGGKFLGTVLTPVPIFLYPSDTQREIGPGDLVLDIGAGSYTPAEFEEKYLSPDYDEGTQRERYGKDDE
jgi:hypothetical protein